jgi:nucleoside-diphosphate-sugar epimerase
MKYLISGASSTLTKAISTEIINRGHLVTLIGRQTPVSFELENPEKNLQHLLESHDIFLHLAHSFEDQLNPDLNESAASKIIPLLDSPTSKVIKCIFISSDSASFHAKSNYGKSKYRTEQALLKSHKTVIVRIGIIDDDQIISPFNKLIKIVGKYKVLPFPLPKRMIFTLTNINEIVDNLERIIQVDLAGGPYGNKSQLDRTSILTILEDRGLNPRIIISIPLWLTSAICYVGDKFNSTQKLGDSLRSLLVEPERVPGVLE